MKKGGRETDRAIISKLMEDPRANFTQIAKSIGVSTEFVRQKIKKLRNEDKIKFYCTVNGKDFDKRRVTFILNVPLTNKLSVIEKLKALPITLEIHAGVLTNIVVMDISTINADKDTTEILKTMEKLGVEVKEIFESELAYFNSYGLIR